jgi:hypothetical protein
VVLHRDEPCTALAPGGRLRLRAGHGCRPAPQSREG